MAAAWVGHPPALLGARMIRVKCHWVRVNQRERGGMALISKL